MFSSISFDSLALDLERAIAWVEDHGIVVAPTRLHRYRALLKEVIVIAERRDRARADSRFREFVNALFEAHELVQIWQGLASLRFDSFRDRLHEIASGPEHSTDERTASSSNRARNISFELVVASQLARAGLSVSDKLPCDTAFLMSKTAVLVECKRPQSLSKLKDNINDAKRQLRRKLSDPRRASFHGMIAVDITKILNPESHVFDAPAADIARQSLEQSMSEFIDTQVRVLNVQKSSGAIAFLLRMTAFAHCIDSNMLMYCQQWGLAALPDLGTKAYGSFADIQSYLGARVPSWQ